MAFLSVAILRIIIGNINPDDSLSTEFFINMKVRNTPHNLQENFQNTKSVKKFHSTWFIVIGSLIYLGFIYLCLY